MRRAKYIDPDDVEAEHYVMWASLPTGDEQRSWRVEAGNDVTLTYGWSNDCCHAEHIETALRCLLPPFHDGMHIGVHRLEPGWVIERIQYGKLRRGSNRRLVRR